MKSRAKANLTLVFSFTLQTSPNIILPKGRRNGSRVENNCLLNPPWIDGSISSVNGLLIKLITGLRERSVNSDLVVSTCHIIIIIFMCTRGRPSALRQVKQHRLRLLSAIYFQSTVYLVTELV